LFSKGHIYRRGPTTKNYTPEQWKQHIYERVMIHPVTGCWIWQKAILQPSPANPSGGGYGMMYFYQDGKPKMRLVHVVAYLLWVGPIPAGRDVCHHDRICTSKACCNPDHLYAGTPKQNTHDLMATGRFVAGKLNGGPHTKGSKWYTNGTKNRRWVPGQPVPSAEEGWRPGQTANHKKKENNNGQVQH